jgi:membrane-associated phospholipid phosphatase
MRVRLLRVPERHRRQRPAVVVVLLLALVLFAALADQVAEWQPLVSLDRDVDEALHQQATPWVTTTMEGVSWLGSSQGLLLVTIAAASFLVARRHLREAALVALAFAGGELLYSLLKVEFARPRPSFADPVVPQGEGYSFPSGHATASMAVYGALAYLALTTLRGTRWPRVACTAGLLALVAAIAFSRLYLGKHFPSDVIAGWCVAAAWLAILALLLFPPGHRQPSQGLVFGSGLAGNVSSTTQTRRRS